ncbi:MAG: prepilin-type cleavage/methylation domain-containing protein [Haliea sp.]|nr:prepilin-type cleavage/methylation domain-containing protein [Haliea sp.]|tara:strand:- start:2872 stop:3315 length:444 start_codon:yes stop_codon:yes gene_type:complete
MLRALTPGGRDAGFTLIEVMIVVVIVGILLMVALPSYQGSLQKGRRSDAISALLDAANRQEQYLLDQGRYTLDMTQLGYATDPLVSDEGHYSVDAAVCTGGSIVTCYELTATPVAGSPQAADDRCTSFTLDSFGNRSATGTTPNDCW